MDRNPRRRALRLLLPLPLAVLILTAGGCANVLSTAMWVIYGNNNPAEYEGLRGKRVAVVVRPPASLEYTSSSAANEVAKEMGRLLATNVKDIEVISQRRVAEWTDENTWDEFQEIGDALGADLIIGVDLNEFRLYAHQTLFQGTATASVAVYDMQQDGLVVWDKDLPRTKYPPNAAIPTSEKTEPEFRRQFVRVLADEIGRHFYAHDAYANFNRDNAAF